MLLYLPPIQHLLLFLSRFVDTYRDVALENNLGEGGG